jgi:hypothetical protein
MGASYTVHAMPRHFVYVEYPKLSVIYHKNSTGPLGIGQIKRDKTKGRELAP